MVDAVAQAPGGAARRGAPRADAARRPRRRGRRRAHRRAPRAWRRSGSRSAARCSPCSPRPPPTSPPRSRSVAPRGGGVQARRRPRAGPPPRRATCAVFTRSLDDVTARVPEVVEAALALPATLGSCSTARRSRCARTGARSPSRSPPRRLRQPARVAERATTVPLTAAVLRRPARRRRGPARPPRRRAVRGARPRSCPSAQRVPRGVAEDAPAAAASSTTRWPAATRASWSSRSTPPTRPAGAAPAG